MEDDNTDTAPPCRLVCQQTINRGSSARTETITAEDGSRCGAKTGSLAVCIGGRCEAVGCDLEVASGRSLDRCGVCGGNGTSCPPAEGGGWRYRWERVRLSRCSASCGGGTRMVRYVCRDGRTGEEVAAGLCPLRDKPTVLLDACNQDACPPR
jgi:Thrombospondin type 1 domain